MLAGRSRMALVGREQDWQYLVSNRAEGSDPSTGSCVLHILSTSENPTLHSVGWSLSGFDAVLSRPAFNSLFYRDQLHIILYVPSIGIWQITVLEVALFHWFPPSSTNVVECASFLSITGLLRVLFLLCGSVIFMSVFSLSLAFVIIQNLVWITGKQMVSSN